MQEGRCADELVGRSLEDATTHRIEERRVQEQNTNRPHDDQHVRKQKERLVRLTRTCSVVADHVQVLPQVGARAGDLPAARTEGGYLVYEPKRLARPRGEDGRGNRRDADEGSYERERQGEQSAFLQHVTAADAPIAQRNPVLPRAAHDDDEADANHEDDRPK
eukprot:355307-Prymnesium_polylepis.1